MMRLATIVERIESAPTKAYPNISVDTPPGALVTTAWKRVEHYTAWRFAPRTVKWIVQGPGVFKPDLAPLGTLSVSIWSETENAMGSTTLAASPYGGYELPAEGPYQFEAIVGELVIDETHSIDVPEDYREAVRRLAQYLAQKGTPGVSSESIKAGSIDISRTRSQNWMAMALQNSGAADLLRSYRKV